MLEKFQEILGSRRFWQITVIAFVQFMRTVGWIEGTMADAIVTLITTILGVSVTVDTLDKLGKNAGGK